MLWTSHYLASVCPHDTTSWLTKAVLSWMDPVNASNCYYVWAAEQLLFCTNLLELNCIYQKHTTAVIAHTVILLPHYLVAAKEHATHTPSIPRVWCLKSSFRLAIFFNKLLKLTKMLFSTLEILQCINWK